MDIVDIMRHSALDHTDRLAWPLEWCRRREEERARARGAYPTPGTPPSLISNPSSPPPALDIGELVELGGEVLEEVLKGGVR